MNDNIISLCKSKTEPEFPNYPDTKTLPNGKIQIINTADNLAVLCEHVGFKPAINKMNDKVLLNPELPQGVQTFADLKSMLISQASKSGLPKGAIDDHIMVLCAKNTVHPVKAWIEKDTWDGTNRVDAVLESLNFREKELSIKVMKHWLVSGIAALYEPYFSNKIIPIIQGGQSWTKTAAIYRFCCIQNIAGTAFLTGKSINPKSRDSIQRVLSSWIVELGEFESTSKSENGPLKAFFTEDADTVRFAYATELGTKKRQTIFIGTVNESEFLTDKTGNRRYMVLPLLGPTDMDSLNSLLGWEFHKGSLKLVDESKIRQFWLEVKSLYDGGYGWVLPDDIADQAEALNGEFLVSDPLEEKFNKLISFNSGDERVLYTSSDICEMMRLNSLTYAPQIGKILNSRFPNCKTRRRINGIVNRVYILPKIRLRREQV